jgi:hypothetical protein
MDYAHYIGCALLGLGPALVTFFLFGAKRRAWIPHLAWWLSLILGVVLCFYGMSHAIIPSFSTRITAVGKFYDYVEREGYRGDTTYGFRFVPEDGEAINIHTRILLPHRGTDGRTYRVIYLQDDNRRLKNEAVDITILSGKDIGFHASLDARPFGSWLAIPVGVAFFGFGMIGLRYRKDDANPVASDDVYNPST